MARVTNAPDATSPHATLHTEGAPGPDGRTPVQEQLAEAVAAIRAERFEARPGSHCERCAFRALCPTQVSGTVLH